MDLERVCTRARTGTVGFGGKKQYLLLVETEEQATSEGGLLTSPPNKWTKIGAHHGGWARQETRNTNDNQGAREDGVGSTSIERRKGGGGGSTSTTGKVDFIEIRLRPFGQ